VIDGLQTSFAPGALFAVIHRIERIALDLLCPAVHDTDEDALCTGTTPAKGGVPVVMSFDQVFGQHGGTLETEFTLSDTEALTGNGANG